MTPTPSDLKIIAANGGGMILDASKITPLDLKIIAANASSHQAAITLRNAGCLTPSDMKIIAANSKGCVVFDFA
ncbi:MAG: hypothetical protein ABL974_01625 [Prosthecobacter sp.]